MSSDAFRVERRGRILELTLTKPERANAIDTPTSREIGDVFAAFRTDPDLSVAIITGEGERHFCAGWDLKSIADADEFDFDMGEGGLFGIQEAPLNKPLIAAINGAAVGGGFELALCCDLIVAAEHVYFQLPEVRAGILADAATIKLHRRIPYHVAVDMLFTGRRMPVDEADKWGLIYRTVEPANVLPAARELAETLADGPPLLFSAIKETLWETETLPVPAAFDLVNSKKLASVKTLYESDDMLEGPRAFAEKRDPVWTGR